jgi:hypothetical protein
MNNLYTIQINGGIWLGGETGIRLLKKYRSVDLRA